MNQLLNPQTVNPPPSRSAFSSKTSFTKEIISLSHPVQSPLQEKYNFLHHHVS